jgi:AraC-like DNA-binding protein
MKRSNDGPGVTAMTTRDLDQAHNYIEQVFTPHRLMVQGTSTLGFNLRYSKSPRITVGHLTYGAGLTVDVPPPDCYHLILPIGGGCSASQRHKHAAAEPGRSGVVLSPQEALTVHWEPDAVEYIIQVPRPSLDTHLSRLIGHPVGQAARFSLGFDLTTSGGQALLAAVRFLWSELARPGGIATVPLAQEHLEYAVLAQLVTVIPNNYSEEIARDATTMRQRRVRKVIDLIEAHPEQVLSTGHLAASAGVSERALQLAFRAETGTSPAAYVRSVRLDRVHAELRSGAAAGTVTEVAARWGFFHPSRFAQQYRARFGALPSETLTRA